MNNVIKRIVIKKLYDKHDYDITFDEEGITLITGPNGFGKTTLLNIIKNSLELNFWFFYHLLFQSITIELGDGTKLSLEKIPSQKRREQEYAEADDAIPSQYFDEEDDYNVKIEHLSVDGKPIDTTTLNKHRYSSLKERVGHRHTMPHRYDRGYSIVENFSEENSAELSIIDTEIRKQFGTLRMFANGHRCLFVRDQRVLITNTSRRYYDDEPTSESFTITQLADKIKEMYIKKDGEYTIKSQQIDSTFIQRVIESNKQYEEKEYNEKKTKLHERISKLKLYGLIKEYKLVEEYKKEFSRVLSMHIDDMFDKFQVYDDFFDKLDMFSKCVNEKGLSNKKMKLDPRSGISFISDSKRVIPLHKLSSGEQNMVILYYRLIFNTNNETLLMIDEPENSIHVGWLENMLEDYIQMQKIKGCQIIIATHSPTFINGNWNIAYDLQGGSYKDWMESHGK